MKSEGRAGSEGKNRACFQIYCITRLETPSENIQKAAENTRLMPGLSCRFGSCLHREDGQIMGVGEVAKEYTDDENRRAVDRFGGHLR